jgi:DHA3 family macrolide efflux protein-like MFS transporter
MAMANGPAFALFQAIIEPDMQARVFTVIRSMAAAMSPLGTAAGGPVADALDVRVWYVMGGVACMLMGIIAFVMPTAKRLEDSHSPHSAAAGTVLRAG